MEISSSAWTAAALDAAPRTKVRRADRMIYLRLPTRWDAELTRLCRRTRRKRVDVVIVAALYRRAFPARVSGFDPSGPGARGRPVRMRLALADAFLQHAWDDEQTRERWLGQAVAFFLARLDRTAVERMLCRGADLAWRGLGVDSCPNPTRAHN